MAFRNQTLLSSSHLLGSDISGVVARQSQYFEYQGVIHNPGLPCTASLCIETRIARCTNPKCPGPQPQTLKSPHSSIAKLPHIELSKPGVAEAAGSKVPAARGQHDPCAASGSPGWGLGGKHPFEQQDSDHAQAPKSRRRPGIMCAPSPEQSATQTTSLKPGIFRGYGALTAFQSLAPSLCASPWHRTAPARQVPGWCAHDLSSVDARGKCR